MSRLDDSIILAVNTHKGQVDLGGHPYILHPLRILTVVEFRIRDMRLKDRESILCSAVLHDVIEDSIHQQIARERINEIAGEIVLKTVDTLTRNKDESWKNYINRVKEHWDHRIIKIVDLEDNRDTTRLSEITEKDIQRDRMYLKALQELREVEITHGHRKS